MPISEIPIGLIINGATGRMGTTQHLKHLVDMREGGCGSRTAIASCPTRCSSFAAAKRWPAGGDTARSCAAHAGRRDHRNGVGRLGDAGSSRRHHRGADRKDRGIGCRRPVHLLGAAVLPGAAGAGEQFLRHVVDGDPYLATLYEGAKAVQRADLVYPSHE